MRDLKQNACPVACCFVAAGRTAVLKVQQDSIPKLEDLVAAGTVDTDDRAYAAGVMFVSLVVQPGMCWRLGSHVVSRVPGGALQQPGPSVESPVFPLPERNTLSVTACPMAVSIGYSLALDLLKFRIPSIRNAYA